MSQCLSRCGLKPGAIFLASLLVFCGAARAQRESGLPGSGSTTPAQRSTAPMNARDAGLIQGQRRAIAHEAAFFGYDLSLRGWDARPMACAEIPDYLLLQYRRTSRKGALSIFTALVPRQTGRVYVVPVLYGSATPYRSAVGSERSLAVFNRVVPSSVARKALNPGSAWLHLALCYAEIAGGSGEALTGRSGNGDLAYAPSPTLQLTGPGNTRAVIFAERSHGNHFLVWTVSFDRQGRAVAASETRGGNYASPVVKGKVPREKEMRQPASPKAILLPPAPEPKPQPAPQ